MPSSQAQTKVRKISGIIDVQLLTAVSRVPKVHGPHLPRRPKLQRGGEQTRGIHASNLPDRHHPTPNHPP